MSSTAPAPEHVYTGIGVSPGIARGQVFIVERRKRAYAKVRIEQDAITSELSRMADAWHDATTSLLALRDKAGEHGGLVDAHLLMLADPMLTEGARKHIADDLKCAEWAIRATVQEIRSRFDALGDAYFRERRSDVGFVGDRLLDALARLNFHAVPVSGAVSGADISTVENAIIVAHDLSPADVIALSKQRVRAIVTEVGGTTSHTAILARALELPTVIACKGIVEKAANREAAVVDGERGEVVLSPSHAVIARCDDERARRAQRDAALVEEQALPAVTTDGHVVTLLANIEIPEEVKAAVARGAEGIGLYRSEFLFLNRQTLPTATEHEAVCQTLLRDVGARVATLRTFDLGSDKLSAAMRAPREQNPALGLRGVRLGFAREAALRAQLRGMAAAMADAPLAQVLVPMVGNVAELRAVRRMLHEEIDALRSEGRTARDDILVGAMIELPAAVLIADELADEADFFSVGTNDLIQYLLAIDRSNEHVAHLYDPLHPAVLRALDHVVKAGHARGIKVGLCGELAADPSLTAVCTGLGFDSLSMPTASLRDVKHAIRTTSFAEARAMVEACLAAKDADSARAIVHGA